MNGWSKSPGLLLQNLCSLRGLREMEDVHKMQSGFFAADQIDCSPCRGQRICKGVFWPWQHLLAEDLEKKENSFSSVVSL